MHFSHHREPRAGGCTLRALLAAALAVLFHARAAHAWPPGREALALPLPARLVGGAAQPAAATGRGVQGPSLGVDGGPTLLLGSDSDEARGGGGFGVQLGYSFGNGLSLQGRYDLVGVSLPQGDGRGALQSLMGGLRYTVPFLLPGPFAELGAGAVMVGGESHFGATLAAGVSFPITRHLSLDLAARDWLVATKSPRQALGARAGLVIGF